MRKFGDLVGELEGLFKNSMNLAVNAMRVALAQKNKMAWKPKRKISATLGNYFCARGFAKRKNI